MPRNDPYGIQNTLVGLGPSSQYDIGMNGQGLSCQSTGGMLVPTMRCIGYGFYALDFWNVTTDQARAFGMNRFEFETYYQQISDITGVKAQELVHVSIDFGDGDKIDARIPFAPGECEYRNNPK
jgi:hypothetical protein